MNCERTGCANQADGALAFAFYPPKAVMEHYKTDAPLTKIVSTLKVCRTCSQTLLLSDLMDQERASAFVKMIERSSGVAVDVEATKPMLIAFEDPDYLQLVSAGAK